MLREEVNTLLHEKRSPWLLQHMHTVIFLKTTSSPPFFLRDGRASEKRARVKITPREKRRLLVVYIYTSF